MKIIPPLLMMSVLLLVGYSKNKRNNSPSNKPMDTPPSSSPGVDMDGEKDVTLRNPMSSILIVGIFADTTQ